MLVWRRRGLYQASIHSKIAEDNWAGVAQSRVSSSSRCIVDQNDSIMVSTLEATRPIDPSRPASRSRCPNTHDVYWVSSTGRCNTGSLKRSYLLLEDFDRGLPSESLAGTIVERVRDGFELVSGPA